MKPQEIYMLSTEFQPRSEYALVKPIDLEKEKKSDSGIVISLGSQASTLERPGSGEVIAVGSDVEGIESGDMILWPETDGLDLMFNDGQFMLIRDKSILGKRK